MFNSNIWPHAAPLRVIMRRNMSDLDFDPSMSLKIMCDGVIVLPIYEYNYEKSNVHRMTSKWP